MKQDNFKSVKGLVNGWQEMGMYFNYLHLCSEPTNVNCYSRP
jgi:hypothetical protein